MERIVRKLIENNKTISTMESCTGGALANAITNIPNASKVIKFSAVTYSNEFKEKMGIPSELIDKYTVYSSEVAREMAESIAHIANSSIGIGITEFMSEQRILISLRTFRLFSSTSSTLRPMAASRFKERI